MSEPYSDRAYELFMAASELPEDARDAWLTDSCGDDSKLRREIETLLKASPESEDYFSQLAERLGMGSLFEPAEALPHPESIGPYRLTRQIGRGGMGAVYLAERADRQFEKRVAVKTLPTGMVGDQVRQRFLAERQILARLLHPGIARLLDGGVTRSGTPYFVMDYIEGDPIDVHCDEQQLDIDARLDLFQQVCEAVQYAHRNLVVHRDLKPGNILVTREGEARLLDFGIAKLVDEQAPDASLTQTGRAPMTLAYASPELIRGEPVTTACDVYALGVLLYRLLTGHPPYDLQGQPESRIRETICESEPPPASRVVLQDVVIPGRRGRDGERVSAASLASNRGSKPPALESRLRGDLDTILAKALRKEPEDRYSSVESLLEDIRRHRTGLPVLARPPSIGYRAGKFLRRHRTAVTAAAAAFLALAMVAILSVHNARTSAEQGRLIALERDKAEQIKDFLLSMFELSGPNQTKGDSVTARELLDQAAGRIRSELDDQPERQAALYQAIGQVYSELSLFDQAMPLLDEALRLHRESGAESEGFAETLMLKAEIVEIAGDYEAAAELAMEVLQLRRRLGDEIPTASALLQVGRIAHKRGQSEIAEAHYRQALAVQSRILDPDDPQLAHSLSYLGSLLEQRGELEEAEVMQQEALAIRRAAYGEEHIVLIESLHNLSAVFIKQKRYEEAQALLESALGISMKLLPEGSSGRMFLYNSLGTVFHRARDLENSAANYRRAMEVGLEYFGESHPNVAIAAGNLGGVLVALERYDEAESLLGRAIDALARQVPTHTFLPGMRLNRGICLLKSARYDEAEILLVESHRALEALLGKNHGHTRKALASLDELYSATGKTARAAALDPGTED